MSTGSTDWSIARESLVTPKLSAKAATMSWSSPLVAMMVRARVLMPIILSIEGTVSVGWQWASKTPRCHGKDSSLWLEDPSPRPSVWAFIVECIEGRRTLRGVTRKIDSYDGMKDNDMALGEDISTSRVNGDAFGAGGALLRYAPGHSARDGKLLTRTA